MNKCRGCGWTSHRLRCFPCWAELGKKGYLKQAACLAVMSKEDWVRL